MCAGMLLLKLDRMTDQRSLAYLRRVLQQTGLSPTALAEQAGVSPTTLTRPLNNPEHKFELSMRTIRMIESSTGILFSGDDNVPAEVPNGQPAPADAALVPVYDVSASAGGGSVVEGEDHVTNLAFSRDYLREMTQAKGRDLAVIRVKGDSMEPTLLDDDLVMIDRTKRNLDFDGLFVLRVGEALHVKRIGRGATRSAVTVISDNRVYPPVQTAREEVEVIGKVLWYGRKV